MIFCLQKAINLSNDEEVFINIDDDKPFSAFVFKTIADPFVGKISLFRVMTGKISGQMTALNTNKDKQEKLNHLFFMKGKNPEDRILAISHCNCPDRAQMVKEAISKRIGLKDIFIADTAGISSMYANDGGIIVVC